MESMFDGCTSLEEVDVSGFNTQEVINMCAMFQNCSTIKSLAVNNWNTSKVINMSYMFFYVVH